VNISQKDILESGKAKPIDRLVDEGETLSMIFQAVVDATDEAVLN